MTKDRVMGQPGSVTCSDCGAVLENELRRVATFLQVWERPEHSCQQREDRLAAEEAERRRQREEWLNNPPPGRISEVRNAARLASDTPAGLDCIRADQVDATALRALLEQRAQWLAGERPAKGLWLWGPTNHRKTMLTAALLFDIQHRTRKQCLFWNFGYLMEQLRREAQGLRSTWDATQAEGADILALDDIGTRKITESAWSTLYTLVEQAKSAWNRPDPQVLYVTTNEAPEVLMQLLSSADRPDGGERIVRRLVQLCDVVEVA